LYAVHQAVDEEEEQLLAVVLLTTLEHGVHLRCVHGFVFTSLQLKGVGKETDLPNSPKQAGGGQTHVS
jgi:hypothetical protein